MSDEQKDKIDKKEEILQEINKELKTLSIPQIKRIHFLIKGIRKEQ